MKDPFPSIHPALKGIMLAFTSSIGMANVYVFSKVPLLQVNYFLFRFYWFAFALLWILSFLALTGMLQHIPHLNRASNVKLVIMTYGKMEEESVRRKSQSRKQIM